MGRCRVRRRCPARRGRRCLASSPACSAGPDRYTCSTCPTCFASPTCLASSTCFASSTCTTRTAILPAGPAPVSASAPARPGSRSGTGVESLVHSCADVDEERAAATERGALGGGAHAVAPGAKERLDAPRHVQVERRLVVGAPGHETGAPAQGLRARLAARDARGGRGAVAGEDHVARHAAERRVRAGRERRGRVRPVERGTLGTELGDRDVDDERWGGGRGGAGAAALHSGKGGGMSEARRLWREPWTVNAGVAQPTL